MSLDIRAAANSDVQAISALVNQHAARNLMLPRSEAQVKSVLSDFLVAIEDGKLVGCGSLVRLTPVLAEIRSLAVESHYQGNGLGGKIVQALLDVARLRGLEQVCALTLRPNFFQNQGFQIVDRWNLTPKIWSECVYCPKFHRCDEVAVLLNLVQPEARTDSRQPDEPPWWRIVAQHTPLPVLRALAPHRALSPSPGQRLKTLGAAVSSNRSSTGERVE